MLSVKILRLARLNGAKLSRNPLDRKSGKALLLTMKRERDEIKIRTIRSLFVRQTKALPILAALLFSPKDLWEKKIGLRFVISVGLSMK